MTTKRIFLSLVYTLVIGMVCWILFLVLSTHINLFLYDYKISFYNHEIDSLFRKVQGVKYVYKSGDKGSIYYVNADTLSSIVVIEATNYKEVSLNDVQSEGTEKVNLSQNKTYTSIVNEPFPLVQQALNPRESAFLKITFEKPFRLERDIKNEHFCYLRGSFSYVAFGNTQSCSIVTFQGDRGNEILVIKHNGKLYFVMQTVTKQSLLEMVDPALLKEN